MKYFIKIIFLFINLILLIKCTNDYEIDIIDFTYDKSKTKTKEDMKEIAEEIGNNMGNLSNTIILKVPNSVNLLKTGKDVSYKNAIETVNQNNQQFNFIFGLLIIIFSIIIVFVGLNRNKKKSLYYAIRNKNNITNAIDI